MTTCPKQFNANRSNPTTLDKHSNLLIKASKLPFSKAFPIYLWSATNVVKRSQGTANAVTNITPIFQSLIALSNFIITINSNVKDRFKRIEHFDIKTEEKLNYIVIDPGERDKAIDFIKQWLLEYLGDYLWISDPYFSKNELEFLNFANSVREDCEVYIITSGKGQTPIITSLPADYQSHWNSITAEKPPPTGIIVVSNDVQGNSPIHDRCWLTNNSALKFGGSLNGLGVSKISDITVMQPGDRHKLFVKLEPFVALQKKLYDGKVIKYMSFSL